VARPLVQNKGEKEQGKKEQTNAGPAAHPMQLLAWRSGAKIHRMCQCVQGILHIRRTSCGYASRKIHQMIKREDAFIG
jgi:hypothetical protein